MAIIPDDQRHNLPSVKIATVMVTIMKVRW